MNNHNHVLTIVKYDIMSSWFIILFMKIRDAQKFSDEVVEMLVQERERLVTSKNQLAKKACLSVAAISLIERNKRRPTLYTLKLIADAVGVRLSDIIRKAEDNEQSDKSKE